MTREQKAKYLGDKVGRWQPAGRRLTPGSEERVRWQESQLRSVIEREGLGDLWSVAYDALIERATKQSRASDAARYRRAYGPDRTRKPSTRKLVGESRDEYVGRLRSYGLSQDEIYKKAYGR